MVFSVFAIASPVQATPTIVLHERDARGFADPPDVIAYANPLKNRKETNNNETNKKETNNNETN